LKDFLEFIIKSCCVSKLFGLANYFCNLYFLFVAKRKASHILTSESKDGKSKVFLSRSTKLVGVEKFLRQFFCVAC
jgi:hypothetical protein